ncbi:MgtC/SapB family protein [Roseimaritima sediminicola]|uniref:MgtC/SapB family protein n=1 Tax=Roseimaritima sediminicola TaxID=2662066 RepID=UPI001298412B|nr:MgtC/SapB family protein [Roseimaritima sediminicola]
MSEILKNLNFDVGMFVKPLLAIVCGAMLGLNRERRGRAAGLRTQTLVALGSCVFTMSALLLVERYPEANYDPIRVVAGIVGGIGFLGAGSIIQSGRSVRGVTTAATVWLSGAIGIVCGIGWYEMAAITLTFTMITLIGLGKLSHRIEGKRGDDDVVDEVTAAELQRQREHQARVQQSAGGEG